MKKVFCDICGEPAKEGSKGRKNVILEDTVLCDDKAKLTGTFVVSFKKHSTGFGGPPDLCLHCQARMIGKYHRALLGIPFDGRLIPKGILDGINKLSRAVCVENVKEDAVLHLALARINELNGKVDRLADELAEYQ